MTGSQADLEAAIRDAVQCHGRFYIEDRSIAYLLQVTTEEQIVGWKQSFSTREGLACHPHRKAAGPASGHPGSSHDGVMFKRARLEGNQKRRRTGASEPPDLAAETRYVWPARNYYCKRSKPYAQNIGDTIRDPLLILDRDLRVKSANRAFYKTFHTSPEETDDCLIDELGNGQWDVPPLLDLLRDILPTKGHFDDYEVTHDFPHIGQRTMLLNARKLYRPGNRTVLLVLDIEDITERKRTETRLAALHQRDRRIASTLQRALLFMPPEDAFPGLEVKMLHEAASEEALVGGDFWDIFAYDDGHVALVIGDVMGHGLTAAVFTAEIRFILRAFLREHERPGLVLSKLNAYLCESHRLFREGLNDEGGEAPVCLALAVIHAASGEGVVASAGMEPPLLVRADGQIEETRVSGLLLGIEMGQEYESTPFHLGHGDAMLLTTDGITEARHGKEFLEVAGLMDLVRAAHPMGGLEQAAQSFLAGARAFGAGSFRDDVCLILARRQ